MAAAPVDISTKENSTKKRAIDESTIDFNKIEGPNSQKRANGQFKKNLHVRNSKIDLINMITPRGINIKTYGFDVHKNRLAEGNLVTVYCNNKNPNALCQREYDDLMNFVNNKLSVIRDNPYELNQVQNGAETKIITEIDNEEKADKGFNFVKEGNKIYGQL
ncbi:MAG: hypothetical protein K0S67_46 [Nitrososphaeraceae archaeon]|jgi:hypothetical protein|nr:hypothetical protein [Nitrososphaeraceae archaeon]